MKQNGIVGALGLALLSGCGGGGGDTSGNGVVTATELAGAGGASVTTKQWKVLSLKTNDNYNGTGADQTCPVTITNKADSSRNLQCGSNTRFSFRSDGSARIDGLTFNDAWAISGSEMTLTFNGNAALVQRHRIVSSTTVAGRQRIRLRLEYGVNFNSATRDTTDEGSEALFEEVLPTD